MLKCSYEFLGELYVYADSQSEIKPSDKLLVHKVLRQNAKKYVREV